MSEFIDIRSNRMAIHGQLLATVSAAVLLIGINSAQADDGDSGRPQFWIELGGQLSRLDNGQENFVPPFVAAFTGSGLDSPLKFEKPSQYSIDEYGKLSFQPDGRDWVFSVAVQYGKSSNQTQMQQSVSFPAFYIASFGYRHVPKYDRFAHTDWQSSESHTIVDFQVGKDVGLGMFGHSGSSKLDLGVRFAQFSSNSKTYVNADPTLQYPTHPAGFYQFLFVTDFRFNEYTQREVTQRSFRGVGPSVSWQGSSPVAGKPDSAELAIDWGINAAILFGRQKARGHHQTTHVACPNGWYYCFGTPAHTTTIGQYATHNRSRSVIVPNVGGTLGLSFRSGDAKVSFGYHADLFVGSMDTGIDTRKSSNTLFHGPYASISVGIGG